MFWFNFAALFSFVLVKPTGVCCAFTF